MGLAQAADFFDEAVGEHLAGAAGDSRMEFVGREEQAGHGGGGGGGGVAGGEEFVGADDAAGIFGVAQFGVFGGVQGAGGGLQGGEAVGLQNVFGLGAQFGVGGGRVEAEGEGFDVEAGAADDDGGGLGGGDGGNGGADGGEVVAGGEGLVGGARSKPKEGTAARSAAVGLAVPMSMPR